MVHGILKTIKNKLRHQYVDVSDEYIEWLCFANPGMLNRGNLYCFEHAIKNLPTNNPILEIGSFCGLSTNSINYYISKYQKKNSIVCCDRWVFEGAERGGNVGGSHIPHDVYREFVKETFKRNVQFFSKENLPYCVEVFSDDFFKLWDAEEEVKDVFNREIKLGGNISFAYIDGNHTYEYTKRDFENVNRHLDVGGFILFDDSSYFSPWGCAKFMKEVMDHSDYKLVFKNPNYMFQKIR